MNLAHKTSILNKLFACLSLAALAFPAAAVQVTTTFTAKDFPSNAPQTSIRFSLSYEAASATSGVQKITAADFNINGHSYGLGEVGYSNFNSTTILFGGLENGVSQLRSGTDDFMFIYDPVARDAYAFTYTSISTPHDAYDSWVHVPATVTISPVPEPKTYLMLGAGLFFIGMWRRKSGAAKVA